MVKSRQNSTTNELSFSDDTAGIEYKKDNTRLPVAASSMDDHLLGGIADGKIVRTQCRFT